MPVLKQYFSFVNAQWTNEGHRFTIIYIKDAVSLIIYVIIRTYNATSIFKIANSA
jgi:hypothetical protein